MKCCVYYTRQSLKNSSLSRQLRLIWMCFWKSDILNWYLCYWYRVVETIFFSWLIKSAGTMFNIHCYKRRHYRKIIETKTILWYIIISWYYTPIAISVVNRSLFFVVESGRNGLPLFCNLNNRKMTYNCTKSSFNES